MAPSTVTFRPPTTDSVIDSDGKPFFDGDDMKLPLFMTALQRYIEEHHADFAGTTLPTGRVCASPMRARCARERDDILWLPTEETGVVDALVARRNVLQRPDPQGRRRPVAANIDLMLIVFAPEPAPQANLIDRYLVAAENMEVEATLVLNKADLLKPDDALTGLLDRYAALGYRTLTTHHELPDASDLTALIGHDTLVLVGQSGVGKSSLIQRLLPDASIRVGEVSEAADKGRHTTTTAELFHLPGGGRLIDSPGVRRHALMAPSVASTSSTEQSTKVPRAASKEERRFDEYSSTLACTRVTSARPARAARSRMLLSWALDHPAGSKPTSDTPGG